jgi:alcohol dehydrogenase
MKAAVFNDYGSADVIEIVNDLVKPEPSDGVVVIKVHYAGINPFDYKVRGGTMKDSVPFTFPKVPGMDMSGVVESVGENSGDLKVSDEIYGQANFFAAQGSIAEFTTAKVSSIAAKPSNVSFSEAAALPLTAVSAYQALVDNMSLSTDQKVLIHGGAGGIGTIAIQLAKHIGAYVATTVSTKDIDYVKELGADQVIDFKTEDFVSKVKDFDCVLDLVGGEAYKKSFEVLKSGGILVSLLEQPDNELSEKYSVKARHQGTVVNSESLEKVTELVEQGAIKAKIEKEFSIEQTADAFRMLENDHPKGKVVIKISD